MTMAETRAARGIVEQLLEEKRSEEAPAGVPWACVQPEGPRTRSKDGSLHPIFYLDQPLNTDNPNNENVRRLIRCPTCRGTSVRVAFEGETDEPLEELERDPRLVEMEKYGFHNRRPGG